MILAAHSAAIFVVNLRTSQKIKIEDSQRLL
jgi:hypothetical protein